MPHLLVIAGTAIINAAAAAAAAAAAVPVVGGAIAAGITSAGAFAAGLVGVTAGTGFLAGTTALSLSAAISSWSTVALFASSFLLKPKVGQGPAGASTDFQADPNAGIPLMLGRGATAGKIIHANTSGDASKNVAMYYLLALTGGPLGGFEMMFSSDWPMTFDGIGLATSPAQYAGAMYLEITPGRKPDPQAYYPGGVQLDWITEWTAAHKVSGVACAWWTLVYNTKAYPTGAPKPLFVIQGPPVYDPRADSTYPGGSGTQRWNDETTWGLAGNDNPFLQGLSWCLGRWDNGKLTFGIGAPRDAIDVAAFVEGANVCDANVWKVGGEVLSSDRKWDVLTTILQAGGGEPVRLGGLISCQVRAPRVVLGTLVGADVIGDVSITGTKRRRDRLNQIIPSYRSEFHRWEIVPADPIFVNEYIAVDGGLRSREGNYPLVQDAKQVGQLATYDLVDAREFEPIVLPVGPRWYGVKPGDCIIVDEPEFGLANQQVVVQTRDLDLTTGRVTLTCRSETPGKHDYALGRTATPPPIPGFQPFDPGAVARPDPGTWTAVGTVLTGADGAAVPAIVVTGHCNDPNVSGVIVEYQLELAVGPPATFGEWVSTEFPSTTRRMEFRAVISGATYHVQVRYRSVRNVEGALALDLGLVTVGTLVSGGVTQIGGQTPQDLIDQLNDTTALGLETSGKAADNAHDIIVTNENLVEATTLSDGTPLETYTVNGFTTAHNESQYSATRVDAMGILRGDNLSFQMSQTTLWASPTQTWGQYQQSIQTNFNTANANLTTETNLRVSGDQANATSITTLSTTVGQHTSSITTQQTSIDGLNSQWVLAVSSTGPGYARVAGIKVAATPAVSSIAFAADQIGFTNGVDNVYPLAVVGNKVIATSFQADDIKANTITTDKIVANNIDVSNSAVMASTVILTPTPIYVLSNAITITIGYVEIDIWGNVNLPGSGGSIGCMFDFYIDGTFIQTFGNYCFQPVAYNTMTYRYRHNPGAGTHTYQINGYKQNGGGAPICDRMFMKLTNKKTQAP